jgi:hypothetical protein
MMSTMFSRMAGEVAEVGPGKLEREKPYLNPSSIAESLYYRGLIAAMFVDTPRGAQATTYVPTDLAKLMPTRQNSYAAAAAAAPAPAPLPAAPQVKAPENVRAADTSIVDDLATLLAYLQLVDVAPDNSGMGISINEEHRGHLKRHLIGSNSAARISLLVALVRDMGLVAETGGLLKLVPTAARKWLEMPRPMQVKAIAEAWRDSTSYNELWHVPGLKPEKAGWQNDPLAARQTVLTFFEMVPPDTWWSIGQFVEAVKEDEPEFQRPNGDYDSWYIRDAASGQYLRGFGSWDKVDGAMLRFILIGPMHGLGLLDLAQNNEMCRLTAYGRAFLDLAAYPTQSNDTEHFTVATDGTCTVERAVNRYARFQLARFTDWLQAGNPYQYRISAAGLEQAAAQNIKPEQIIPFLKRSTDNKVPESVLNLIEMWGHAGAQAVSISQMIVMRVPTPELLESILSKPNLRRYVGVQLGTQAIAVRADQWKGLVSALQANGIPVEVDVKE